MFAVPVYEDSVTDVVSDGLAGSSGDVLVVNPDSMVVRELLRQLDERDAPPSVRIFAADDVLADVVENFFVAGILADLIKSGVAAVRVQDEMPHCSLFIDETRVWSILEAENQAASVTTEDPDVTEEFREYYNSRWQRADEFNPRTPPLSELRESLATDIGPEVADDFEAMLESSLSSFRDDDEGLDGVVIALLVAARHGVLQYDISRWGEDVGLASSATFSRIKKQLEEAGLLGTETVPIEVGRPRYRLQLANGLAELSPAQLADRAKTLLE